MKHKAPTPRPPCPHCGGEHWGQKFNDCTFVNILADPNSTDEQRQNATAALEAHRASLQEK